MTKKQVYLLVCSLSALTSTHALSATSIEHSHSTSVTGGFNSNVYRTPDSNYVDWGQTATPAITPDKQSGFFTELDYKFEGAYPLSKKTTLLGDLSLDGKFYLDSDLTNANETKYKLDFGAEHILSGKKRRVSSIEAMAIINAVDKTYYDRDTGLEKTAGITDVADRYSYKGTGIEIKYKNKIDKTFQYGAVLAIGSRDYTDTIANSQMDYSYTTLGADVDYQLQKSTTVNLDVEREVQDYDERSARNLSGTLLASQPELEYTYLTLSPGIKHKLNDNWTLRANYSHVDRADGWLGYNDYTAQKFKLRAIHKTDSVRTKLSLSKQSRDYPRALAFDKPVNGVNVSKTYDTLALSLSSELQQTENRSLWGKVAYNNTDTNDLRYNYDRFIIFAGYKWQY